MIDFTKITALIVTTDTGIDIQLREIAVVTPPPAPVPATPPPVVEPPRWTYPSLRANLTYGPSDVAALVTLLESNTPPGLDTLYPVVVCLTSGTYNFPRTIYPKLQGSSAGILFIAEHGAEVTFNFDTSKGHGFFFQGSGAAKNVWIRRIRFSDLRRGDTGQGGFQLVKFDAGESNRFYECDFDNCRASGIYSNAGAKNLLFFGCVFRDNGVDTQKDHGAYMHNSTGNLTFDRCVFVSNASHGLDCFDGSSSNVELIHGVTVRDCTFLAYGEPCDRPIIFQDNTSPTTVVKNNHVSSCAFFNAFPATNETEIDRDSVKFVRPEGCVFKNNVLWNVPLVAPIGVDKSGNVSVPPVNSNGFVVARTLDSVADRHLVTVFNYAMLDTVAAQPPLPAGRYYISSVAAPPIGNSRLVVYDGSPVALDMAKNYAVPQHRLSGFAYPTHKGANVFRFTRIPD